MADLTSGASAKIQLDPGQSLRVEAEGGTTNVTALYGAPAGTTAVTGSTTFGPYSVPAMLRVVCASGACSYATVRDEPAANALTAPQVTALQAVVSGDWFFGGAGGLAGLGDSITANGVTGLANLATGVIGTITPRNWLVWASLLTGGRVPYAGVAATGGFTTQQIIDTHLQTMLDAIKAGRVSRVAVLCGTNDIGGGVPIATTIANLRTIYAAIKGAGAQVIACQLTPRESAPGVADITANRAALSRLNAWIAAQRGVSVVDFHTPTVTTAGLWVSGMNADNVHPNSAGAKAMGQALANVLMGTTPVEAAPWLPATSETTGSTGYSQTGNPLFTDTNSDGTPDGVTTSGSPTMSTNTTGTGLRGNWCKATATSASTAFVNIGNSITATVGDQMILSARIRSTVEATPGANCDWAIVSKPSDATVVASLASWDRDVPDGCVLRLVAAVPSLAAETSVALQMKVRGATGGNCEIAQAGLFNATTALA